MVLLVDEFEVAWLDIVLDREGRTYGALLVGRHGGEELLDLRLIGCWVDIPDDDYAL